MKEIKRNQLAELIVEDGQPSRAIINYLQETMDLLSDFDCVTDYYKEKKEHPLIIGTPNLVLNKDLFLEFLSGAYAQLRIDNQKQLKITDLYMSFNWEYSEDDAEADDGFFLGEVIGHGYYLNTSKKEIEGESVFFITFKDRKTPIIASICIDFYDDDYYGDIDNQMCNNEYIKKGIVSFMHEGKDDYYDDLDIELIEAIIPMSKILL